jgi:hypothetical protein
MREHSQTSDFFEHNKDNQNADNSLIDDIKNEANQHQRQAIAAQQRKANRFPIEVFPKTAQFVICQTNHSLKFPFDFIGSSMLFAASVAIGNTFRAKVKTGWMESATLYIALVGRAGTNKSHPLSFALQPIFDKDSHAFREYEHQRKEYDKAQNQFKKDREQQGGEEPIKPILNKSLVSDFTPEALVDVLKFNQRGIGVYADELASWFKNFNRYNSGSEMEFWLQSWSGKPINIDRKTGEPAFIPLPFISVCGTIQNGVLNELAKDSRSQNGFVDRILFAFPEDIKKEYWNEDELEHGTIEIWRDVLDKLLKLSVAFDENHYPTPEIIPFDADAKRILFEWQKQNTDEANDSEDENLGSKYNKLESCAIRLSLILELMEYACAKDSEPPKSICRKSVEGALQLTDYFKNTAIKIHSIIENNNPLDRHPDNLQRLYHALPDTFATMEGIEIAESNYVPERSFKRFLNDKMLFKRMSRGIYQKIN